MKQYESNSNKKYESWFGEYGLFCFSISQIAIVTCTGDYCEECEVGYYGDAAAGASCIQCPCYEPRVVNSTCDVSSDGNVSCLHCNEGYTGMLCDQ